MLEAEDPDLVLVFPGGRGTQDCYRKAMKMGLRIIVLSEDP
jgi:hypothetical protein